MPHYSEQPNDFKKSTLIDNNISTVKVGPGTYKNFYRDKDGNLKEEKIVYHDKKAVENAENIDNDIKNADKQIANYDLYQNKLNTATAKKEEAEDKLYKAEEKAKETENELREKQVALAVAENQLSEAQEANNLAQSEREVAFNEFSMMDPDSPGYEAAAARLDAAETRCQETENNLSNAETQAIDAKINKDAAEGANNEAQSQRKAAFDNCKKATDNYEQIYDEDRKKPDYTRNDIEVAKNQVDNTRASSGRYGLGQAAIESGTRKNPGDDVLNRAIGRKLEIKANELFDLRNLPGGINFRGIGKAQNTISNENYTLSPSRSFYLTDYRFADSLSINEDLILNPKVQPIILNEFQPYDMLSPADVLDGIGNLLIKTFTAIGRKCYSNTCCKSWFLFYFKSINRSICNKYCKNLWKWRY